MRNGRLAGIFLKWKIWNEDQYQLARGPARGDELTGMLDAVVKGSAATESARPNRRRRTSRRLHASIGR